LHYGNAKHYYRAHINHQQEKEVVMSPEELNEFMKNINKYLESIERELDAMTKDLEALNAKLDTLRANRKEDSEPISLS
jgi:prefoldin subunit 5